MKQPNSRGRSKIPIARTSKLGSVRPVSPTQLSFPGKTYQYRSKYGETLGRQLLVARPELALSSIRAGRLQKPRYEAGIFPSQTSDIPARACLPFFTSWQPAG